jgi:penicillin G amidase
MRILPFIISTAITVVLIYALNRSWGSVPALGNFLSPQHGFWQNADDGDEDFNASLSFGNLKGKVDVYFDERLVPHVFAENDEDIYFVQGYLHAKFRLWQMEFQTFAAAGRISEKMGDDPRFIRFDREQRRLGMVYGAEKALQELEKDPATKSAADNYTAGVNAYIASLTESTLPLEYKLLGYKPEPWSNLKIALFLKQMSRTLAGFDRDLEFTNARSIFSEEEMELLYPTAHDSLVPIVPKGTVFTAPVRMPVIPANADSVYFKNDTTVRAREVNMPDRNNGSNNWAVSGQKTASGRPILANDPHLELTLPSIWYEMQLHTPTMNAYGATFPGTFSVIIGFNDNVAFGFTNAQRDVKDYFAIRFKDASKKEYWFDSTWRPTELRLEEIKIKGGATITDTVAYTVFGPVMYDEGFTHDITGTKAIAVKWVAQEPSNEAAMWLKLNRAKNYADYEDAIRLFKCPGQNMLFASKDGDIAIWQQAMFPARWRGQGKYLMPGEDSSYMWQGYIPQTENPHVLNPPSGYIQSANQRPVDSTYPYYIPGNYILARGVTIDKKLSEMSRITPRDMMALQLNTHSSFAEDAVPLLLKYITEDGLDETEKQWLGEIRKWNFDVTADAIAPTIFQTWFDSLEVLVWRDEFEKLPMPKAFPDEQTLLEAMLRDSWREQIQQQYFFAGDSVRFKFIDNITTPEVETVQQLVQEAFGLAAASLKKEEAETGLVWWKHKQASVNHLLKPLEAFARKPLHVGGWGNTVNAITNSHGPSWRMVVHLTDSIEAYGIYPGGQSGNPGSKYYDNFINDWAAGKYYPLWMMKQTEANDKRVKWKMTFNKA